MSAFAETTDAHFVAGRVLFSTTAGPRRGYGHLLRCRSLARALGVRPLLAIRGSRGNVDVALGLGCDVVDGTPHRLLNALQPDVLIVDDPDVRAAGRWIAAARRADVMVASIHDLGLGCHDADLLIDGSILPKLGAARRVAAGTAYAIVDPSLRRYARSSAARRSVVVSLGGGPRAEMAWAIACEIARRAPRVQVRVIGGFVSAGPPSGGRVLPNIVWVGATTNLARELGQARVAVVGGGVSLYEACALGTPVVGVPVVPAQRPTVAGFVARGAALGRPARDILPRRVAEDALKLLREKQLRTFVTRAARRLVDGRGAWRAARAIVRMAEGH
jgi:spore coat polysaccharide biosynthesis predicted glycosyltransferase SpsG